MFGFLLHTHTYLCVPSGRYVICTMAMGTLKRQKGRESAAAPRV